MVSPVVETIPIGNGGSVMIAAPRRKFTASQNRRSLVSDSLIASAASGPSTSILCWTLQPLTVVVQEGNAKSHVARLVGSHFHQCCRRILDNPAVCHLPSIVC